MRYMSLSRATEPWISRIPQRLANQIVAGDSDENGESGVRHLPGSLQQASAAFTENCAPRKVSETRTPSPKNDNELSSRMARQCWNVAATTTGAKALGRICRKIRRVEEIQSMTSSTNS